MTAASGHRSGDGPIGAANTPLGAGAEFDFVRRLLATWGATAQGIGDDAAVLDLPPHERLIVSVDASLEGHHFRRGWLTPEEIGYRAAAAALSDLAAMAARPIALLLAIALPDSWRADALALARGVGDAAAEAGALIVGGDSTGGAQLALTITVLGATARPITRGGARAGDTVYVTGRFGGPQRALTAFEAGQAPDRADRDRFARPVARVREAQWLAEAGASAMIDVSDGLAADLGHLAVASGMRVAFDVDRVPGVANASRADVLGGGEEYELIVTVPPSVAERELVARFAAAFTTSLTAIGTVEQIGADERRVVAYEPVGDRRERVDLPVGYDHYSR